MKTKLNKIGELLSMKRNEKGLTQIEAGAIMGVNKAMVSKIENGTCVNMGAIDKLSDALGVVPVVELRPVAPPFKGCH